MAIWFVPPSLSGLGGDSLCWIQHNELYSTNPNGGFARLRAVCFIEKVPPCVAKPV